MSTVIDYEKYTPGELNLSEKDAVSYMNNVNGNMFMFNIYEIYEKEPKSSIYIYDADKDKCYLMDDLSEIYDADETLIYNGIAYQDEEKISDELIWYKYDLLAGKTKALARTDDYPVFYGNKIIYSESNWDTGGYGEIIETDMETKKQKEVADEACLEANDRSNIYYLQKSDKKIYRYNLEDGQKNELQLPSGRIMKLLPSDEDGAVYVIYENKDIGRVDSNGVYERIGNLGKDYKHFRDSINDKLIGNELYMSETTFDDDTLLFKKNLKTGEGEDILKQGQLEKYVKKLTGNDLRSVDASFCKDYIVLFVCTNDERHPEPENGDADGYYNKYLLVYDYNGKLIRSKTVQKWRL